MNPMPQDNPMSAEGIISTVLAYARGEGVSLRDVNEYIESRDAQLIRSTLEAAAGRVCSNCPWIQMNCSLKCEQYQAIFTPLDKENNV